jgi:cytosine/adenosine deaminase-related metal-dependent hydrolase
MQYVQGDILTDQGFEQGFLGFDHNELLERGRGKPPRPSIAKGYIIPTLINAHTHIGDSFIRKKSVQLPHDIIELVAPPNGLKHQLLRQTSESEIIEGMIQSLNEMSASGISYFCDFREGGITGIEQLQKAMKSSRLSSLIFSRPQNLEYHQKEVETLLDFSDGIGVSSISDWEYPKLEKLARHARKRKKMFALHASELNQEDIDQILDLKPTFLVHMIAASESDFIRVKEEGVPVAICPRSNAFFNLHPKLDLMKQIGIMTLLGTDNAMINSLNVLDEIRFLLDYSQIFSREELLKMVTYSPRKALNLDDCIHGLNSSSGFVVLDRQSLKPLFIWKYDLGNKICK